MALNFVYRVQKKNFFSLSDGDPLPFVWTGKGSAALETINMAAGSSSRRLLALVTGSTSGIGLGIAKVGIGMQEEGRVGIINGNSRSWKRFSTVPPLMLATPNLCSTGCVMQYIRCCISWVWPVRLP